MDAPITINKLSLPSSLSKLISADMWKFSAFADAYESVFGIKNANGVCLSPDAMERATQHFKTLIPLGLAKAYHIGLTSAEDPPLTDPEWLDLRLAVLIGDTGIDEPFCLDYRWNAANPRVVYLTGNPLPSWQQVAVDFAAFAIALGLADAADEFTGN
ncbi:MAG TPA: hypothetical protein VD886_07410 [Herpetosiphonaceae bacterium]|nr:hypothetical protein [Herpetosiphonaceae bacterium]